MKTYLNINGNSGILAYDISGDDITLQFEDHSVYLYTYAKPGKKHVEEMKKLAKAGKGLCTYVNQYVKEKYAKKLK